MSYSTLIGLSIFMPIPFLPILLVKFCVDTFKRSRFFGGKSFKTYLLPILSFALQGGVIYLIAIGEFDFPSLFYYVVGGAIIMIIVYAPFVKWFSDVSEGFTEVGKLGLIDWFIVFLHLPLFIIILIVLIIIFSAKQTMDNAASSSGSTSSTDGKKYTVKNESTGQYIADEYGNRVTGVDASHADGSYTGYDGKTYTPKD